MNHALVIGGTGMLREAVIGLTRRCRIVSVIAKGEDRLVSLAEEASGVPGSRAGGAIGDPERQIEPILVDYRDTTLLAARIRDTIARHGAIDLVVSWIHSTAPDAAETVARSIAGGNGGGASEAMHAGVRWFDVLGSSVADPAHGANRPSSVEGMPGLLYRSVVLGFVVEGDRSRWLTDAEISTGVLSAVESDAQQTIVGRVRPWSLRPGNRF